MHNASAVESEASIPLVDKVHKHVLPESSRIAIWSIRSVLTTSMTQTQTQCEGRDCVESTGRFYHPPLLTKHTRNSDAPLNDAGIRVGHH